MLGTLESWPCNDLYAWHDLLYDGCLSTSAIFRMDSTVAISVEQPLLEEEVGPPV
jgi:hypothetical protein